MRRGYREAALRLEEDLPRDDQASEGDESGGHPRIHPLDRLSKLADIPLNPVQTFVDLLEALVDLLEALVDLVEAAIDLVEAQVDRLLELVHPPIGPGFPRHDDHDPSGTFRL